MSRPEASVDSPLPVLVTDGEERAALAACRALAAAGRPVTVVAKTRLASALWSRAPTTRLVGPDPKRDGEAFVATVAGVLAREPQEALLPGRSVRACATW